MKKRLALVPALALVCALSGPAAHAVEVLPAAVEPAAEVEEPVKVSEVDEVTGPSGAREAPIVDVPADADRSAEEAAGEVFAAEAPQGYVPLSERGEGGRGTVDALDKYWATNGWPDDVAYAYEYGSELLDDGTVVSGWEIGVVDADESRRQEILDLAAPTCRVSFVDCRYPYAAREAAYEEIMALDDERITHAVMGLNTESVYVWAAPETQAALQAELTERYGSLVVVLEGEAAVTELDGANTGTFDANAAKEDDALRAGAGSTPAWTGTETGVGPDIGASLQVDTPNEARSPARRLFLLVTLALLLTVAALALRQRRVPQPAEGPGAAPLTRRQTEEALRDAQESPAPGVYKAILQAIRDEEPS